jgi:hypothetical protein
MYGYLLNHILMEFDNAIQGDLDAVIIIPIVSTILK